MKYIIKFTMRSERDPVPVVTSAIEQLLRKNESVNVTSSKTTLTLHSVVVDLKLHKAVYHPSDWFTDAVEHALTEGETAAGWEYEQIKLEDA